MLTSGNLSDEPIAFDDDEARARLGGIADAFLAHDRPIHRRCEDSVVRAGFPLRRSRGYAPAALPLPGAARTIVAAGAELKSTFCVTRGGEAFLSPHLGDLDSEPAYRAFHADLALYLAMLDVELDVVAHDLHPEYLSTKWALEQDAELVGVQHHHAHAAACLAEHGEEGPALALVFDGTGYGTDGTLWGGELLRCDLESFERVAHLDPVPLPGGEAAIREPWRVAALHLERAGLAGALAGVGARAREPEARARRSRPGWAGSSTRSRRCSACASASATRARPPSSSSSSPAPPRPSRIRGGSATSTGLVATCSSELASGRPAEEIAARFHETVAAGAADACAAAGEPRLVVLSGGSFQNLRLLDSTRGRLEALGFRVLGHRRVPPNDGGISYGQAAVAARRIAPCA